MDNLNSRFDRIADNVATPLWHRPWWLDLVSHPGTWMGYVYEDEDSGCRAFMPLYIVRKGGVSIATQPVLTSRLGPWFLYGENTNPDVQNSFREAAMGFFAAQCRKRFFTRINLQPGEHNIAPFLAAGFLAEERVTYLLDLRLTEEVLFQGFNPPLQRQIRKGNALILCKNQVSPDHLQRAFGSTLRHRGIPDPLESGTLNRVHKAILNTDSGVLLSAHTSREAPALAMVYLLWDRDIAFAWIIASRDGRPPDAYSMPWLLWQAIQYARQRGQKTFDFDGSMVPGVARFFRQFGASPTQYLSLIRYRWPLIGRFARSVFRN